MSEYWKLSVEKFAKIRKAEIELAPLTLFIGDNNSGKSYLLSLLWGIVNGYHLDGDITSSDFDKVIECWLEKSRGVAHPITEEDHKSLLKTLNSFFCSEKEGFLFQKIFKSNEIEKGDVHISVPYDTTLRMIVIDDDDIIRLILSTSQMSASLIIRNPDNISDKGKCTLLNFYQRLFTGDSISFIPAPRTGFLLTLRRLVSESLESSFSGEQPAQNEQLTAPQISFLQNLVNLKSSNLASAKRQYGPILDFIEKEIIDGQILLSEMPLPEILYKANGMDKTLPLYLSSGVVTEVAGLLSLLKFGSGPPICICEEPELSLHPDLQWKMARVLVKLVNAGVQVWASTHSDIIIQHVNNMIKLSNHPESDQDRIADERCYDRTDIISSDKIRMYQFDVDEKDWMTDVKLLECGKNGFRVPTYGKVFNKLQNETWDLRIEPEVEKQ